MIAISEASEPRCDHPERSRGISRDKNWVPRPCLAFFARQGGDFDFQSQRVHPGATYATRVRHPRSVERGNELQFRIRDQEYFLAFVEQEKRWYVFAPTPEGVNRLPVYVDEVKYEKPATLGTETTFSF